MESSREAIVRLEKQLNCLRQKLETSEAAQQQPKPKEEPKPKDGWDKFQALSGLLTPLMIAVVGLVINGALQRLQLQLSNAKEMQSLLKDLQTEKIDEQQAIATAMTLGNYGNYSVVPLISVLQTGEEVRMKAAERGLWVAGMVDESLAQSKVCTELTQVIANRRQVFKWQTQESAIKVVGDLNCEDSLPAIIDYNVLVDEALNTKEGQNKYGAVVAPEPGVPDRDALCDLRRQLIRTRTVLDPASKPAVDP